MKCLIPILLSLSVLCTSLSSAEYGRLIDGYGGDTTITIGPGDMLEIVNYKDKFVWDSTANSSVSTFISFTAPDGTELDLNLRPTTAYGFSSTIYGNPVVIGPTTIKLLGNTGWIMYKLTRASEVKTVTNSITIPAITNQEWAVTLERSTDLTNWETVAPGTVTGTDSLQFFRLRVGGETTTVDSTSTGGE